VIERGAELDAPILIIRLSRLGHIPGSGSAEGGAASRSFSTTIKPSFQVLR